jgi:hypothetical protein
MRHGEMLARECTCEDLNAYVKTPAMKMTL